MGRPAPASPALQLYLALNAAGLFAAAVIMARLASAGGYSAARMLLVGATALLGLVASALAALLHRRPRLQKRVGAFLLDADPRLRRILALLFVSFWCLVWFPPRYTGDAYYYFIALYPLSLCGLLFSGTTLTWLAAARASSTPWWSLYFRRQRTALIVAFSVLAGIAMVVFVAAHFRILQGYEPYWYGAGVPLLAAQVLGALVMAILVLRLESWSGPARLSGDVALFLFIWLVAAILWASRPVPPSYWITAPRPPNFELYPFSDPVTYDVGSQFALIGQGLFNGVVFDRALYMSFLVYLHLIGGQDYRHLMAIQAAAFAIFPAILYLLGRRLHSRTAGLILAALTIMRGLTSLDASAWIDTANFKHMLTDFPTAIGVAVVLLLMLRWLQAPRQRLSSLIAAGGMLGLTSLLRPHVLLLALAAALFAAWVYRPHLGRGAVAAALVPAAFLLAVLPWLTLGPSSGSLVTQYGERVMAVIGQRFPRPIGMTAPTAVEIPTAAPLHATPIPQPTLASVPTAESPPAFVITPPADPGPVFVVDHFLHNLITSALIFPSSPQLLSIRTVVKDGEDFWRPRWAGGMSATSAAMLVLNLAAVAFGVGVAVQRDRLRGLLPLAGFLLYLAADSLARTSGGRYIVPVDWILILYFSVAAAELAGAVAGAWSPLSTARTLGARKARGGALPLAASRDRPLRSASPAGLDSNPLLVLASVLLLGGLVPLAGVLIPQRYQTGDADAERLRRAIGTYAPQVGSADEISLFLQQPDAVLTEGRLLYPLYYRQDEGEPTRYAPYTSRDFARMVFVHVGPQGILHVVLPGSRPPELADATDSIVLGCRVHNQGFNLIQAIVVVVPQQGLGLVRAPVAALTCPQPDPICDSSGVCR